MRGLTPYSERPKSWGRKDTSARSPDALRRASAEGERDKGPSSEEAYGEEQHS